MRNNELKKLKKKSLKRKKFRIKSKEKKEKKKEEWGLKKYKSLQFLFYS
jgi:hypothetical protein